MLREAGAPAISNHRDRTQKRAGLLSKQPARVSQSDLIQNRSFLFHGLVSSLFRGTFALWRLDSYCHGSLHVRMEFHGNIITAKGLNWLVKLKLMGYSITTHNSKSIPAGRSGLMLYSCLCKLFFEFEDYSFILLENLIKNQT